MYFQGLTLHVSASKIKFLEVAEELELRKRDKCGLIREFNVSQLDDFLEDGMHVDDLLTTADKQYIVRHELENIRALTEDDQVPGYPAFRLYEGQSIGKIKRYIDYTEMSLNFMEIKKWMLYYYLIVIK
jgi:anoctamin-10